MTELAEVDWHKLGTQLNVPSSVLNKVDQDFKKCDRKLNEVFQYWLQNDKERSWVTIINALERLKCHSVLCKKLRKKYCVCEAPSSKSGSYNTQHKLCSTIKTL